MKTLGLQIADIIVQVEDDGTASLTSSLHSDDELVQDEYDELESDILLDWADGVDILGEDYRADVKESVELIEKWEKEI